MYPTIFICENCPNTAKCTQSLPKSVGLRLHLPNACCPVYQSAFLLIYIWTSLALTYPSPSSSIISTTPSGICGIGNNKQILSFAVDLHGWALSHQTSIAFFVEVLDHNGNKHEVGVHTTKHIMWKLLKVHIMRVLPHTDTQAHAECPQQSLLPENFYYWHICFKGRQESVASARTKVLCPVEVGDSLEWLLQLKMFGHQFSAKSPWILPKRALAAFHPLWLRVLSVLPTRNNSYIAIHAVLVVLPWHGIFISSSAEWCVAWVAGPPGSAWVAPSWSRLLITHALVPTITVGACPDDLEWYLHPRWSCEVILLVFLKKIPVDSTKHRWPIAVDHSWPTSGFVLFLWFKPCSSQASLLWHLSTPHYHMKWHWQIFVSQLCWIVRTKCLKLAKSGKWFALFHCFEVRTTIANQDPNHFCLQFTRLIPFPTQVSRKKLVGGSNWFVLSQTFGSEPRQKSACEFEIVLHWILIG